MKLNTNTFGFLPTDMDRSIFQARVDKIKSLPLIGQYIILEFEKDFEVNSASGLSFGIALENIINAFEQQFKVSQIMGDTSKLISMSTSYSFNNYPFISSLFRIIGNCTYSPNNYSAPFSFFIEPTISTYYFANQVNYSLPKKWSIGTTGLSIDSAIILKVVNNYTTITPSEFFSCLKATVAVIKWLESENSDLPFIGTIDGVKAASYEAVLNDQLSRINNLSDIVANANNKLISDGQAKKDAIAALIATKKIEIEGKKKIKRENIASMNTLASNYDAILNSQKTAISQSLGA